MRAARQGAARGPAGRHRSLPESPDFRWRPPGTPGDRGAPCEVLSEPRFLPGFFRRPFWSRLGVLTVGFVFLTPFSGFLDFGALFGACARARPQGRFFGQSRNRPNFGRELA